MKYIESRLLASAIFILSLLLPSVAWAESEYQLTVVANPTMAGTFNKSSATLYAGVTIQLVAYSNSNFTFIQWTDESGAVISKQMKLDFVMPDHDCQLTAEYEYNPANPANPVQNYWNKLLGEVVVDDFTTGSLQNAVKNVIGDSKAADVMMITVAGIMNANDFGIINTYSACTLLDFSRVTGVTQVPSYAFDNTKLEAVYLPATIESIGTQAFYGCKQLTSMVIYAITPPSLGSNVFTNVPDGLVVYVPASAISLYQDATGWKNFTILPIQEDIRSISVSLPDGTHLTDYTNMWLELTNTKSGQKLHYVMTDRQTYTFANIIRNTSWNVTLRNERGDVFGQIDNVEVKDEDVSVAFSSLSKPQTVVLSVLTPDGQDATDQTQVTWTDAQGNYVAQGVSLTGLPTGYQTTYRVLLSQELAMAYNTPQPVDYVLTDGDNRITCQLNAIPQVKITGKVKDASTGLALSGAVISASQTFGGKYSKTLNTKTDGNGMFTLDIANVPTSVAFAASDYVSQAINCDSLLTGVEEVNLPDVSLKTITGATITLGFTYTPCEGETQNWYSDYQNVSYGLFNVTKNKAVSQYNVQYPQIVLLEEVDDGNMLRLTATSRTNAFKPVETTATIAEQKAEATFDIVELGQIRSTFTTTGNASVVGSLYDATGKLVKTYDYTNASLTISNLADGNYTLVTMGSSRLFNTIYDLAQLPQTGLAEGSDYVLNRVEVKSGQVSAINISEVPTLDESKLYYTGDNTSFTVNKPSIVAGNYLTLTGRIDFKPTYATSVSNVQMIVDLPESCEFVENSVMVGNSTSSYTLNGHQITIPMDRYTDRVRFCIIPTLGGDYAPSAFAQFDLNGETVTQPIGSANYTAKDLSISVPSTVAKTAVPVSGTAIGTSSVEIYDNDVLIGQTTSMANGTWATTCELNEPYNLSTHSIYAKVITKAGIGLQSEIAECSYDKNAISTRTVQMSFFNKWLQKNVSVVFDFEKGTTSASSYMFYTSTDVTFVADLTNNDTTVVSGVTLYIHTDRNEIRELSATYDEKLDRWVAVSRFDSYNLPINISISIYANKVAHADRGLFNLLANRVDEKEESIKDDLKSINELNDAADAIDQQIGADKEIFATLEGQIEAATGYEEMDALLVQWMTQAGLESSIKDFAVEIPETINEDYIQSLTKKYQELLDNNDNTDHTSAIDDLLKKAEEGLSDDGRFDYITSLQSALSDTIVVDTEKGQATLFRTTLEKYGKVSFEVADTIRMEMTDGNNVYVLVSTGSELLIVDSLNNQVWYMQDRQAVQEIANARSRRAKGDFVAAMNTARQKLEWLGNTVLSFVKGLIGEQDAIRAANQELLEAIKSQQAVLIGENAGRQIRINEIEKELKALTAPEVISVDDYFKIVDRDEMVSKLKFEKKQALKKIETNRAIIKTLEKSIGKYTAKIIAVTAVLGELHDLYEVGKGIFTTISYVSTAIRDHGHWHSLINKILPCETDHAKAVNLKRKCESDWSDIAWSKGYYPAFSITAITSVVNGYMLTNKAAKLVAKMLISTITDFLNNTAEAMFNRARSASLSWYPIRYAEYRSLKCKKDKYPNDSNEPNKPKDPNDPKLPPLPPVEPIHDPSGYVYEGVTSNRIEGVTATAYYKEMVEDMYGDLHENIVKWDAEEYAQENPLFTDENGFYRWDVPQGLWQVKFEKEGYETTYSEWLPVPPPQLDVNIAMKQNRQPEVKAARAYEDAVEVEFDKYMIPELLTAENIMVMQNGTPVEGTVELLNEEVSYEGEEETFASKVRFNAAEPFTEQEVTLMVSNRVKSYAGIRMQDDFSQTFKIEQEIKKIISDSIVTVDYGGTSTLMVSVLPASASKGKALTVKTSSPMILGVETEQVIINDDGMAEIVVSGELPGTAALTFSVEGTDKTAMTIANVEQKVYTIVATPTANIASGSVVDTGTQITLNCETVGATIYYTLDGSCPCKNSASRIIYDGTPIIINEGVTIMVIAVAPNGTESDVAEYVYTTKDEEDAIIQVPPTTTSTKDTYDISGRKVGRKAKGIIIRNNNGTNRKVLVK